MPTPTAMKMVQDTDENVLALINSQIEPEAEVSDYSSAGGVKTVTFTDTPSSDTIYAVAYIFQANLDQILVAA